MDNENQIIFYMMDKVKEFCHGIYVSIDQLQTIRRNKCIASEVEKKNEKYVHCKPTTKLDSYTEINKSRNCHTPCKTMIHSEPSKSPDSDCKTDNANDNGFFEFFQNVISDVYTQNSKLEVSKVVRELNTRFKALPENQQILWKPNIGGIVRRPRKQLNAEDHTAPRIIKKRAKRHDATPSCAKRKCTKKNESSNITCMHPSKALKDSENKDTSLNIASPEKKSPEFNQYSNNIMVSPLIKEKTTEKSTTPLSKQDKNAPLIPVKNDRPSPSFSMLNNISRA